ncbi:DUF1542 domain-containing protein [Streptococcus suis]|uniref:DUF1542 domain-containing protein n=1 Tax=Streptococcus suis TaxID=1307 RepID=UPI00211CAB37|nr:DUF1542 domain-containing protein [Streptococcus suis]MCQ9226471.1 DUF1542 domain-containing protein [Streptococcus suis]MCQ9228770.1 DUF1542 domain-containing protein [Streptococcus suis]
MNRSKKKSFDWYGARQRFSIRKYHIGAASVLLGMTLVLSAGTIVSAETGVNGDGTSNEQTLPVNDAGTSDGTNSTTQQQSDNQGNNSSGVQTGNTTNSTANVQPADDTGSASSQPVGTSRSANTGTQGDGTTNQPVDEPIIKFPTQDDQRQPAGYQRVVFYSSFATLVFEDKPGEIVITLNGKPTKVVTFWVKTGTTWEKLKKDPQFRIPTYQLQDGDFILGYDSSVGEKTQHIDFDSLNDTPVEGTWLSPTVDYIVGDVSDGKTFEEYMKSGYAPFHIPQFRGITLNANGGTIDGKVKKAFYVAHEHVQWGNPRVTSKIDAASNKASRDGYTFVRWQTDKGEGIPTSGKIETIEFTAVWLKHPEEKVAVFDHTNLTDSEKEQVKQKIYDANPDLSTGVPQVIKAIEISATGEATVTFDDGTAVKVPSATLTNEDKATARSNAKAEIEKDAMEKSAAINASNLTEEEKREKLDEVNNAKAAADSAIDQASTSDELNQALNNGKTAIGNVPVTSQGKAAALAELQSAKEAKLQAIENSNLTDEEKSAATQAVNTAYDTAVNNINSATTNDAVAQALNNGKTAIGNVPVTSQGKAAALAELQSAKEAKLQAIENSNLTDEEKSAATQAVNTAYDTAVNNINSATTNDAVAQALNNGKTAIGNVPVTSQGKAAALAELQSAKEAKLQAIENSNLTDEEKSAATQAVNTAYDTAVNNINNATTNDAVAQALTDGKTAIAGIDTSTSAKKDQAKEDLETAYNAKKAEIENSALTAEEKSAKQAELDKAKADADKAIDAATDNAGVAKALEDGKSAIDAINTTTSAEKAAAKKDLEDAYNAKKDEIAKSSLTAEEKAAKQAELDKAKEDADKAIDAATDASGVAKALEAGKAAIDAINTSTSAGIDTSTSAEKAAAKKDLEAAYNAKKAEIENSALTAEEKAAKQAELDKAKADADKAIDAATDASGVAKALEAGKVAIDAIDTSTSAGIDTSSSAKKARKENKVLPKTGDNVGLSSVLGIAGLALLGTAIRKKRED